MDELRINDGGGLMDSEGMIASLIVDCDTAVKALTGGNHIKFCDVMVGMVRKLAVLKNGVKSMQDQIKELTEGNDADVMEH